MADYDDHHDDELEEEEEHEDDDLEEEDEEEEEDEALEEPQPKITPLTLALCVLNLLAALAFVYLFLLDFEKRQRWTYAAFLHDLALEGLPLREAETKREAVEQTRNPVRLTSYDSLVAFAARRSGQPIERLYGKSVSYLKNLAVGMGIPADKAFRPVDETLRRTWVKPSSLRKETLQELFRSVGGNDVRTLEDEIERLRKALPGTIKAAALEAVEAAAKAAKGGKIELQFRRQLRHLLFPLASTAADLVRVNDIINRTEHPSAVQARYDWFGRRVTLASALRWAAERKTLADLLGFLQAYDPMPEHRAALSRILDPMAVPTAKLYRMLDERFDRAVAPSNEAGPLSTMQKRNHIAFVLVAVSHLRKPIAKPTSSPTAAVFDEPLEPRAAERAAIVAGLYDYNAALENLALALDKIQADARNEVISDREGSVIELQPGKTLLVRADMPQKDKEAIYALIGAVPGKEKKIDKNWAEVTVKVAKKVFLPGYVSQRRELVAKLLILAAEVKDREVRIAGLQDKLKKAVALTKQREDTKKAILAEIKAIREGTPKSKGTYQLIAELKQLENQLFHADLELAEAARRNRQLERRIRKLEQALGD